MANPEATCRFEVEVDGDGLTKLMCMPHKVPVCGRCCMDFGLLNQLQPKLPPSQALPAEEAARHKLLQAEIQSYFGSRLVPISYNTGKTTAPEFEDLVKEISSEGMASMESHTLLVAYGCFAARFNPLFQGSIINILDSLVRTLMANFGYTLDSGTALEQAAQQCRASRRAMERAEKKERKKNGKGKGREYAMQKNRSDMMASIENIMEIMGRFNLEDRGSFMTDLYYMGKGKEESDILAKLLGQVFVGKGDADRIDLSDEMRNAMDGAMKSVQIMFDHTKNGVSFEDCSTWSKLKLLEFLREHKLDPFPVPNQEVLLALAKEMRVFAMVCMRTLESMPEGDEAAALGKQSMGCATPKDAKMIEKMNMSAKREVVMVEPQIPPNFRLDTLEEWIPLTMPKLQDSFRTLRSEWCVQQKIPQDRSLLHHEVLRTFEGIAYVFDYLVENPGKDMLASIQVFEGTASEQALAVRPLGAWIMNQYEKDGIRMPIPIIAVEWHLSRKVDGVRKVQEFLAGLRKGTLFQSIVPENLEEFELLVELLKENRKAIDVKNDTQLSEKDCNKKSWKFSVICPADPNRKCGFVKYCKVCKKRADKLCSRCGVAPYCSQECQASDWTVHKKSCNKKKK